jgi:hypothetical protein
MTSRLPSARELDRLSAGDQFQVLGAWERQLLAVRDGLLSGAVYPVCSNRRAALAASRARLRRLYALADEFGIGLSA